MSAPTLAALRRDVRQLANPRDAEFLQRFFKTGAGQYGEGDRCLGIRVPQLRRLVPRYRLLRHESVVRLLQSPWHEERLLALLFLVDRYPRASDAEREAIYQTYVAHTRFVNNWDLVDASAGQIVGAHLDPGHLAALEQMARSRSVWERRIAIVATFPWIKEGIVHPTLTIARLLLHDPHDLIHKAVGWMLREVGKRDRAQEEAFLEVHYRAMPRTMLRYAIERFPESRRQAYLRGTV